MSPSVKKGKAMARLKCRETLSAGTVPLITMRSDVDFANVAAATTYGQIGIKVWICRGEVFGRKDKFAEADAAPKERRRGGRNNRSRAPRNGSK